MVAWPLTPIVVLFAKKDGWLPNWLYWFQTHDNSLDGDGGWITESRPFLRETSRLKRYVNRCFWLWRNSLYGFNESVLSVETGYGLEKLVTKGNPAVSNHPLGVPGAVKRELYRNGRLIAWQWYYIKPLFFYKKKCLRINLGWKIWDYKPGIKQHMATSIGFNKFTKAP